MLDYIFYDLQSMKC